MDHLDRVREEFTRQADTFDAYAVKADDQVAARFQEAIGSARSGKILDVACGPGVVTAALAGKAQEITAFDATPAMLEKAQERCADAGLQNVQFAHGNAEFLPFNSGVFDGVVNRLAIHHFPDPKRVLGEMFRVLRPGGIVIIADVVVSEDAEEASLQNAIERIRDPSHMRMLPASELGSLIVETGFEIRSESTWSKTREFKEWMEITNDPQRIQPLHIVVRALAAEGRTAGMGLSIEDDEIVFIHCWRLIAAQKPAS